MPDVFTGHIAMSPITKEHFLFADALTQKTVVFRQSLVIHCCWHIRPAVVNHPVAPKDVWQQYLMAEKRQEWFFCLLEEMVIHALSLPAHDHTNPAVGTFRGIQSTMNAIKTYQQLQQNKELIISRDALPIWKALLVKEGLAAENAEQLILAWVKKHALWQ